MMNPDEYFSRFPEIVCPSNVPVSASEISGFLRLERGVIHVFLVVRDGGENGRRHFIATLHPGDWFPSCPFLSVPGHSSGREYGYLLVPQTPSTCRSLSMKEFAAFLHENPAEKALVFNRLTACLTSVCGDGDGSALRCMDVITLPETVQAILRKTADAILRREQNEEENAAEERLYQKKRRQEQFRRLQEIIRPSRRMVSESEDPLFAALRVVAGKYGLPIRTAPPEEPSGDPEHRLLEFCRIHQWRSRRIQLEAGFSRLHHPPLIGFHGPEARPCVMELNGDDSVWYFPGEEKTHPLTPKQEPELRSVAYSFYETLPLRPLEWKDLVRFVFRGSRKIFLCIFAVGILVGLFGLVAPVATAYVTGKIIPTANTGELWQLLILLLALTTGTVILNAVPQLCLLLFGSSVLERVLAALFDRIFRLPMNFFHKYSAGDLCSRLISVLRLQELAFQMISRQFLGSLFALCSMIMLFYYSWRLTVVAVPLVLIYVMLLFLLFRKLETPLRTAADRIGWESGFLKQVFDGIGKIRGAGAEERIENRFLDEFIQEKKACDRYFEGAGTMTVIGIVLPAVINLIFYGLIGKVWRGSLEISGFLAFLTAYGSFQAAVISIGEGVWSRRWRRRRADRRREFWTDLWNFPMLRSAIRRSSRRFCGMSLFRSVRANLWRSSARPERARVRSCGCFWDLRLRETAASFTADRISGSWMSTPSGGSWE